MKAIGKIIAWVCIFSIFLMGCYNTALLRADDEWFGKIPSDKIEQVAAKDGTRYQFVVPPVIVKDTVVIRPSGNRRDKLCSNEIDYVIAKDGTKYSQMPAVIERERIPSGHIEYIVMKNGTRFEFDEAPAIVNDAIVGAAVLGREEDSTLQVSLDLSDVAEIYVSEFSTWRTLVAIPLGLYLLLAAFLVGSGYHGP